MVSCEEALVFGFPGRGPGQWFSACPARQAPCRSAGRGLVVWSRTDSGIPRAWLACPV